MYPIHLAIEKIEDDDVLERVVRILLEAGANIETRDEDERTPLMYASLHGYTKIVRILLEAGANAKARDSGEWTPLTYAGFLDHREIVKILQTFGFVA